MRRTFEQCTVITLLLFQAYGQYQRPRLVYGTAWKEERTEALTAAALGLGFIAVDTANQPKHYNEPAVAAAVDTSVSDESPWIQSKFTHLAGHDSKRIPYNVVGTTIEERVFESYNQSAQRFNGRLSSFLLHAPVRGGGSGALHPDDLKAWAAIERLYEEGRVPQIGVSNFGLSQLKELERSARVRPQVVSNRCTAKTGWDRAVRRHCDEHGIDYQAFGLLTWSRHVLQDEAVLKAAEREVLTPAQLVVLWALQLGMDVLTGPTSRQHMIQDLAVWRSFHHRGRRLQRETMELLESVGGDQATVTFFNDGGREALSVYWVDSNSGELRSQGEVVAPGAELRIDSHRGHVFVATSATQPLGRTVDDAMRAGELVSRWVCCSGAEQVLIGGRVDMRVAGGDEL